MLTLLLLLLFVLGTSNATDDAITCTLINGEAISAESITMGKKETAKDCINACKEKNSNDPNIDGVKYGMNSEVNQECRCEKSMTGWRASWKSCIFDDNDNCNFKPGDGLTDSGYEEVGPFNNLKPSDCVSKCIKLRETKPGINGAVVGTNDATKLKATDIGFRCYCEREMTRWKEAWKSCQLIPNTERVLRHMRTSLSKLGREANEENLLDEWSTAEKECINDGECVKHYSSEVTNYEKVANGFDALSAFTETANSLLDPKMHKGLVKILGALAPFLGACGPIINIISLFGDSIESQQIEQVLQVVNKGFQRMESRFDQVNNKLKTISLEMKQLAFEGQYKPDRKKFSIAKMYVNKYFSVTEKTAREQYRKDLNATLRYDTTNAIHNVRMVFLGKDMKQDFCEIVIEYSKTNRRIVMGTLIDWFNLMVEAVQSLLFIGYAEKLTIMPNELVLHEKNLKEIGDRIDKCDNDIKTKKYEDQWVVDVEDIIKDKSDKAGKENVIAQELKEKLEMKYDWREWMIVVWTYKKDGATNTKINTCDGNKNEIKAKFTPEYKEAYNVIVTSVEKDPSKHVKGIKPNQLAHVANNHVRIPYKGNAQHNFKYQYNNAKQIYEKFPWSMRGCDSYLVSGVVPAEEGITFVIKAPSYLQEYRVTDFAKPLGRNYHLFSFGYVTSVQSSMDGLKAIG